MSGQVICPRQWAWPSEPEDQPKIIIKSKPWKGLLLLTGGGFWWVFTAVGVVEVVKAVWRAG